MTRIVFDIETDGLLKTCTTMWIICTYDLDTNEAKEWYVGDLGWIEYLDSADQLIGHNIAGFDLSALKKLFNWKPAPDVKIIDTLVMSQVQDYRRFGFDGHSLARWGQFLGYPKIEFEDWTRLSEEMKIYCRRDVSLSVKVYRQLLNELHQRYSRMPAALSQKFATYLRAEHYAMKWNSEAELHGWPFDVESAKKLFVELEKDIKIAVDALEPRLGTKVSITDKVDGEVITKMPKWTKAGCYDVHTARYFGVDPWSGFVGEERMIEGEYCRFEIVPLKLNSATDVKIFLFRNKWVPTEWNYIKKEVFNPRTKKYQLRKVKSSPKVTDDSLELLGGDGKLYAEYKTAVSRHGILKSWLEEVDEDGLLHGKAMTIGTPSMRATHSIIVNVPSAGAKWGKEMRSLFGCLPGWKFIGADSAGNQARGLAHYLGDPSFTDTLLNGDIHAENAERIKAALMNALGVDWDFYLRYLGDEKEIKKKQRTVAKRVLYAFLFGASGSLLHSYVFGNMDSEKGDRFKDAFVETLPGFTSLTEKLEATFDKTSALGEYAYIPSLAGNRIYVDSKHKLLVYQLQAAEKITCSTALMLTSRNLENENIPYIPLIFYHDEIDFMVPEEFAERAAEIAKESFKEGPKLYEVEIMDGDAKIGNNWYECH